MTNEDATRIMSFRQLKSSIRNSTEHLIIGIDVGKETHHAFMGTTTGKTLLRKLVFSNDVHGFSKLLDKANYLKNKNGLPRLVFGLEPTGNYHKALGMHLIRCAFDVVMVSGVAVRRNRELIDGRWDKHDTKCAANIADLISQGKCIFYESPISKINDLRELLHLRKIYKKEEHRIKMRIRNDLITKYFPELDKYFGQGKRELLGIVKWCLDPGRIGGMEFEDFVCTVTGRKCGLVQKKKLKKIHELSVGSIGCSMSPVAEFKAKVLANWLEQVRSQVNEIEVKIEDIAQTFEEYHFIRTIPGFGPYIAALVLAKIGDPSRFENKSQVLKMAGFDLSAIRSGKSSGKAVPVISKKGSGDLRYALCQAAVVASSKNTHFIKYFQKRLKGREKENGIKLKRWVKLGAKMLVIAWTLMKNNAEFDPVHLK